MPEQPKRPKNLVAFIVFITVVLIVVGGAIYYYITKVVNYSPSVDDEATVPCRCQWVSEDDPNYIYAEASGHLQGASCIFPETFQIGGAEIDQCTDITTIDEVESMVATQTNGTLGPGVIAVSSEPVIPPTTLTDDNQTVKFTVDYSLYSLDQNAVYEEAEMKISYPDLDDSPEVLTAELTDENSTTYTYQENGQTVTGYRVTFLSTWNEVINYGESGLYKVAFKAKDNNDVWTDPDTGTLQFVVGDAVTGEYYCNNIDVVQTRTTDTANVTVSAIATLPEGSEATYTWDLDMDCSGDIDDDEIFETSTSTITKEFTYPEASTTELECEASVAIELSDGTDIESRSEDSCIGAVTMKPLSEMCGDGILDEEEECDPAIDEDDPDYQESCQDDCTLPEEEPEEEPTEEDPDEGKDSEELTTELSISQTCPTCISLAGETPTAEITILVQNSGDLSQTVRAVSNSLPQGFEYSEGSSLINEETNTADKGVTVETSGDSQLVTWDNDGSGWVITGGGEIEVKFTTIIAEDATAGTYTNTVTVTPSDEEPIQSEKGIVLSANCEQPETALFDRTVYIVIVGTGLLVIATLSYYTGLGTKRFAKMMDQVSDLGLLVSQPQKYRENRIQDKALRDIKRYTKDRK